MYVYISFDVVSTWSTPAVAITNLSQGWPRQVGQGGRHPPPNILKNQFLYVSKFNEKGEG